MHFGCGRQMIPRSAYRAHVFQSRHRTHDRRVVAQPGTGEIRRSPSGNRALAARSVSRRVRLRVSRATRVHRALARRAQWHRTRLGPAALHVAAARARDRTPVHRVRVTRLQVGRGRPAGRVVRPVPRVDAHGRWRRDQGAHGVHEPGRCPDGPALHQAPAAARRSRTSRSSVGPGTMLIRPSN
jgi:hypothetical protein